MYFYNKTKDKKYLDPVDLVNPKFSRVEGGIARYTIDEDWIIPHFEKMLYDNTRFIILLSKYCKINPDNYFKDKLAQTLDFLIKIFLNKEGFLGSAYDADSEGEEGKYYVYKYEDVKY